MLLSSRKPFSLCRTAPNTFIRHIFTTSCLYYLSQPSVSADNTDLGFNNSWYHAQPHPILVYYLAYFEWKERMRKITIVGKNHGPAPLKKSKFCDFVKSEFSQSRKTIPLARTSPNTFMRHISCKRKEWDKLQF